MTRPERTLGPGVLFVVPAFHPNLYFATRALAQAGIRVQVVAAHGAKVCPQDHVRPHVVGLQPSWGALGRVLAEVRPDLMLLRGSGPLTHYAAMWGRLHGVALLNYDQKLLSRRASLTELARLALQGRPFRRVTPARRPAPAPPPDPRAMFLPLPVGRFGPPQPPRLPSALLRVLAVAKLAQPRKRVLQLIEELTSAGEAGRIELTLVGSTTLGASSAEEDILSTIRERVAAHSWLHMLEDQPFHEMPALYAAHDVCILPSSGEPLGSAPLEGMAYGTVPVISSDAGSAGMIREGENGLTVDVRQPGEIARAIDRLAADRALLARLSAGALATAAGELSEAAYVATVRALIASRGRRIAPV
ncbi:glycosyltransferase family 4 protein [Frigidibacter sp.]|uniref:glycosyltransferase family 4 protein n=1 Tax=Frigidibacter sp. TaxID=2586418 RepID=UPI002732FF0E|nr:glycosyltransferase family 4 protein [Frigidibacter sp.]MDP3342553.1 glycosyltransferase family 4 protein [Frigidibacter sp.]